jgi:HK97 gp10 family phage protein
VSSIELRVQGHEELKKSYYERSIRIRKTTDKSLQVIGKILKEYATKKIKTITGSRSETRYNPKRVVRVSNPKAYPNHDTGKLVKGLRTTVRHRGKGKSVLEFQSRAPYALDLEFGTRTMAARPYMRRTLKANRKRINAIIGKGVKRAL